VTALTEQTEVFTAPRRVGATPASDDVVDILLGLSPGSELDSLRRKRPEVRDATQSSFDALFEPPSFGDLKRAERELAALRVAVLQHDASLTAFYRARALDAAASPKALAAAEQIPLEGSGLALADEVLRFTDRLTLWPDTAKPRHLEELQGCGLTPRAIVTLAQLVAFVNYQVRLLAGLRGLQAGTACADGQRASAPRAPERGHGFTLDELAWRSWLPTVDLAHASSEQLAVLDASNASARRSPYYLTLVHEPAVLRERSRLFNAIMYGPGGLPRAERELATVAVSRINGCPYCASVHARLFAQLTKEPQVVQRLLDDGIAAPLEPRRRALVDLAADLTQNPPVTNPGALRALRLAGVTDAQTLDSIHVIAIFAWANRLMQTLGEPVIERQP